MLLLPFSGYISCRIFLSFLATNCCVTLFTTLNEFLSQLNWKYISPEFFGLYVGKILLTSRSFLETRTFGKYVTDSKAASLTQKESRY